MAFVLYRVAVMALVFGALLLPAAAQDPAAAPEPIRELPQAQPEPPRPDWVVTCAPSTDQAKTTCQMAQVLFVPETGQPLLSVIIRPQAEDRRMGMLLTLPHGIYFPPGLNITVDKGETTNVAVQTSDQNGAYAAIPLTDELIAAMKLGRNLNIAMRFADGRDVVVPLTLNGFTAAFEKLTSLL